MKEKVTIKKKLTIIALLLLLGVLLTLVLKEDGKSPKDIEGIKGYVVKKISVLPPEEAYGEIKDEYRDESYSSQHLAAHYFGEALFEKLGKEGVLVCDEAFGFGCYHGLFIKAISEEGIEAAEELDKVCVEKHGVNGLGCPHGIGHGLGEYMGSDNLLSQLEVCSDLTWKGRLFGCQGGVFMEHNFPTVIGESTASFTVRKLEGENYYEPCSFLPEKFKSACYFEQASWWREVLSEDYQKMGELCSTINDNLQREDCFRGIGNTAAETSRYDIESVYEACEDMSSKEYELLCRAGASWAFFANPDKRSLSSRICEGSGNKNLCLEKSDLLNER